MKISPDQIRVFAFHLLSKYREHPGNQFWVEVNDDIQFISNPERYEDLASQIDPKNDFIKSTWLRNLFHEHLGAGENVNLNDKLLDKCCQYLGNQNAKDYFSTPLSEPDYFGHYCVWWCGSVSNADEVIFRNEFDVIIDQLEVKLITHDKHQYYGHKPFLLSHKLHLDLTNKEGTERVFFILHVGEADSEELTYIPGIFVAGDSTNTNPCSGPVIFIRKEVVPDHDLLSAYFDDFRGNSLIKSWTISDVLEVRKSLKKIRTNTDSLRAEDSIREKQQLLFNQTFYLYYYKTFEDRDGREDGIGRAILRFGNTTETVTVQTIAAEKTITYTGRFYLVTPQTLSISLHTETQERDLSLKFMIGTGQIYPFSLGVFSNIGNQAEPIAGTVLLEHLPFPDKAMPPIGARKGDDVYSLIHPNITRFFSSRRLNLLTTRVKGIFSHADFAAFFNEQEAKRNMRKIITRGKTKIFIASPMSSQVEDFEELRPVLLKIVHRLREQEQLQVYYAGEEYNPEKGFILNSYFAAKIDFKALESADHIFIVHPRRVPSSSLVEIGYALGLHKMCHIFYKDRKDLPFILRDLQQANVLYYIFEQVESLPDIVQQILDDLN